MKRRTGTAIVAMAVGLIFLLGYFVPIPLLASVRLELAQWAIILAGVAVLVGIFNLVSAHYQKIRRREKGSVYSAILVASLLGTLILGLVVGPTDPLMQAAVEAIIFPVEASLMAVLAVTLVYASIRLLRRRANWMSVIFLGTAVFMLVGTVSLPLVGKIPLLGDWLAPWLAYTPAAGGARGILLGVALGALTTGLRALFAMDRPYGGK